MNNLASMQTKEYLKKHNRKKRWLRVVTALSCVVVFYTTYMLILPAITMEKETYCGYTEHTEHSEACYSTVKVCEYGEETDEIGDRVLICGQEESVHEHGEACYHIHTEECFEKVLTCELPIHEHSLQCYSNPDLTESKSHWEESMSGVELTGVWADDLVAIAESQLGYEESTKNYLVQEDGVTMKGYTRYGDWYGDCYGDWCAMFVSFCLNYANIPQTTVPYEASCPRWVELLSSDEWELMYSAAEYTPSKGDIIFFDYDYDDLSDHVGIVAEVDEDGTVKTIEGNSGNYVSYRSYSLSNDTIMGYAALPFNPQTLSLTAAANTGDGNVLVVAASDFQDPLTSYTSSDYAGNGDYSTQTSTLTSIISQIRTTYSGTYEAYGFLAGGDYCFDETKNSTTKTQKGVTAVKSAVLSAFDGIDVNMVLAQGNHDAAVSDLASSGANDTAYYGVFVMNEDDYRSYPLDGTKWSDCAQSESKAQHLADSLETYLAEKAAASYDKPIFIVSHVPLHFSTRTVSKNDAIYADYFYDAIYEYGDELNIIFLFGHDHAWGDDDYLGGSSVFLTRGDTINIAEHGSNSNYSAKPLNFTYMNYGYTGYYFSKWASSSSQIRYSNADSTLTMTAFVINGSTVTISRWGEDGIHNLKSVGAPSQGYRGVAEVCGVTTNTVESPQTVSCGSTPGTPDDPYVLDYGATKVKWDGIDHVDQVTSGDTYDSIQTLLGKDCTFTLYDFTPKEDADVPEGGVQVYLPCEEKCRVFGYEDGEIIWYEAQMTEIGGEKYMLFTAPHFSIYGTTPEISQFVFPEASHTEGGTYWVKCTATTDFNPTDIYMVVSSGGYALGINSASGTSTSVTARGATFTEVGTDNGKAYYTLSGDANTDLSQFKLTANGTSWKFMCANSSRSSYGLRISSNSLRFSSSNATDNTITLVNGANDVWRIYSGDNYLIYNNGFGRNTDRTYANMTIYKQVSIEGQTAKQLAVQKAVSRFNTLVDADTEFTFCLKVGDTDVHTSASPFEGTVTIYSGDTIVDTVSVTDGAFTLTDGQTALFSSVDTSKYFFVEEAVSADIASVAVTQNGSSNGFEITSDDGCNRVPVLFNSEGDNTLICFTNTPAEDTPCMNIHLQVVGTDEHITQDTVYTFTVKNSDSTNAAYDSYQILDDEGEPVGESVEYSALTPSIYLKRGQTVSITGLTEDTNYIIEQNFGQNAEYIERSTAKVNGESVEVTESGSTASVTVQYGSQAGVEFTNILPGHVAVTFDFGDGTSQVLYADENGIIAAPPTKSLSGYEPNPDWYTQPSILGEKINFATKVFEEDTTLYAHWVEYQAEYENDAELTKSLNESTAYQPTETEPNKNVENVFDIDLSCQLPQTEKVGVVMVLDISSSMRTMCLKCGHYSSSGSGTCPDYDTNTGYDGTNVETEHVGAHTFVNRMEAAISEGTDFLDQLYERMEGKECYVEIIVFDASARVACSAMDIREGNNLATLKAALSSGTGSGTNIAEGLYNAYTDLNQMIEDYNLIPQDTYVVLLSDGAPTTNSQATNYDYLNDTEALTTDYINGWMQRWSQFAHYDYNTNGWSGFTAYNIDGTPVNDQNTSNSNKVFKPGMIMGPPYYADKIREMGSRFYSVMFGVNQDNKARATADNWKYVSGIGIDNQQYIASFSDYSVYTNTAEGLGEFYDSVIKSVTVTCTNAVVTDPMSDNVEFLFFTDANGNRLETTEGNNGTIVEPISGASYNPNTRTITWNPDSNETLHYKVRLKNEMTGFRDYTDTGTEYVTNGETRFTYDIEFISSNGQFTQESRSKTIIVPYVHGWLSDFVFQKYGGWVNDETAVCLPNMEFELRHIEASCPECHRLAESDRAQIEDMVVVSDENGVVDFSGVPSGHTYVLSEISSGNYKPACDYLVKVEYGSITVTPVENDNGYWSESNGTYRLFNPCLDGSRLPETGGSGTLKFTLGGLLLIAGAFVYKWILKRRCERRAE